jgi:type I restriction enzyme M protein
MLQERNFPMDEKSAQESKTLANFVWQIAETLRGDFKQSEYGKIILPFVVLRPARLYP